MFKAILFDFDGVLAATLPWHLLAWQKVMQQDDMTPDEMTIKLHEGAPAWQIAVALYQHAGIALAKEKAKELVIQKNRIFLKVQQARVYPEIFNIIEKAKSVLMPCGIVTGTTLENITAVLPAGWSEKFTVIIHDGDTERGKPFPDPYLAAINKLKITPAQCLIVENAPLGIRAAKAAEAFCVALQTTLTREQLQDADVIYVNHRELDDAFFTLIN